MNTPDALNPWAIALRNKDRQDIYGLYSPAAVYFAWQWFRMHQRTACVVLPTTKQAHDAYDSLFCFEKTAGSPPQADLFLELDTKYHLSLQPDQERMAQRQRTLAHLIGGKPRLIITTPWALCQNVIAKDHFQKYVLSVGVRDRVDRAAFKEKLLNMGYQPTSLVEDVGTFSEHGFSFDVYSPTQDHPLRLEFFDDDVEHIRTFSPESQRSIMEHTDAVIAPFQNIILDDTTIAHFQKTLKLFCDHNGIPKSIRDDLGENVQRRVFLKGLEGLMKFFYPKASALSDFLPADTMAFVVDEALCNERLLETRTEVERGLAGLPENLQQLKPFESELAALPQWKDQLARPVSRLSPTVSQAHSTAASIASETNEDIRRKLNPSGNTPLLFSDKVQLLRDVVTEWTHRHVDVTLCGTGDAQRHRLEHMLQPVPEGVTIIDQGIPNGFRIPLAHVIFLSEEEIFGKPRKRVAQTSQEAAVQMTALQDLQPGDYVAHMDHGVARFEGLRRMTFGTLEGEFLCLIFRDGDQLYLPVDRLSSVSKYADRDRTNVHLDKLGSGHWEKVKAKAKRTAKDYAAQLIELYARRKKAHAMALPSVAEQDEQFEAEFPFEETRDQEHAIIAVHRDLSSDTPSDRLICGDVGFGKTEVAMRAAFRVASRGHQVAVLVPTTLLCLQHETTFRNRFKSFPLRIESLSRFQTAAADADIIKRTAEGKVDIIIGTHRLLSQDVSFKNLGLLIVDEEQRFGVTHKERIRQMKEGVHTITMTATPIPRTLHLSLLGLRDLSLINTPPQDRLSVRTFVSVYEDGILVEAVQRELSRQGQTFVICPRVQGIEEIANHFRELFPKARISVAHGQMSERELEKHMIDFYQGKIDILVATTIVESGLDVPNANTMIVVQSDRFGLAQVHQLRGRIGRSNVRGYCYLTVPSFASITEDARKRLHFLQTHSDLGSGFALAHYDLDLRGAGEILGDQQSGHIQTIGLEAYLELLNEAVAEMRDEVRPPAQPEIRVKTVALFPDDYIHDVLVRMRLYRRLSSAQSLEDIDRIGLEIDDRFGPKPREAQNMLILSQCRFLARAVFAEEVTAGVRRIAVRFTPAGLKKFGDTWLALVQKNAKKYQALSDGRLAISVAKEVISLDDAFAELMTLWDAVRSSR